MFALTLGAVWVAAQGAALAHCQVPCGIYGDGLRFDGMIENVATISKAMRKIEELSADPSRNMNQITRWVLTKEEHADKVAHVMSWYFLQQRIKTPRSSDRKARDRYLKLLELAHRVLVKAMKCKQGTDQAAAEALEKAIRDFRGAYEQHGH